MVSKLSAFLIGTVFFPTLLLQPVDAEEFILEDAERFAQLFSQADSLDATLLEQKYLELGTKGITIFTPYRIQSSQNLAQAIAESSIDYKKGIQLCLPAAKQIRADASQVLRQVQTLLNQTNRAPTYLLFGANNSGGTANSEGLSLGLEVLCRFAETREEAEQVILGFVAHEIVHVYQARIPKAETVKPTLLRQALTEGFADLVANIVLGKVTNSEVERHNYGSQHEAQLWSEFKLVMNDVNYKPWMYGPGNNGRPNDLGYWLGKKITEAYYHNAKDKQKALQDLLYLEDPQSILLKSGYNPI